MKKKLEIWWIDDDPARFRTLARGRIERPSHPTLKGRRGAKLIPKKLSNEEESKALHLALSEARRTKTLPHLVIIDQILNRKEGGFDRGSTLAVSFRAEAPTVPAVGVTAASLKDIAELQKDQFIEFFCLDDLQSGARVPDLFAIADGFAMVIRAKIGGKIAAKNLESIFRIIGCPIEDRPFLGPCVPSELANAWDQETPHIFARWVWHTLIGLPGFLYDELQIATLLGLTEAGFLRITEKLSDCVYNGVFASAARPRWWVSAVRKRVRDLTHAEITTPLWKAGREILGPRQSRYLSKCYSMRSSDCVPDVVAFVDELRRRRVQAKSEHTELAPEIPPVGFEPYRLFKGQ